MPESTRFLWITLAFLAGATAISFQVIRQAQAYRQSREAYTSALHFEKRLLNFDEWFNDEKGPSRQEAADQVEATLDQQRRRTHLWAGGFGLLALLYLGLSFRLPGQSDRGRTAALIVTALTCLGVGLSAPMLEIAAFQRDLSIPLKIKTGFLSLNLDYTQHFPGDMYFYYQSKSVLELIGLLFRQHNWIVAVSILLFSVLIPFGKNSLGLYTLYRKHLPQSRPLRWLLLYAGKWSMADVFVVAIFLGFLAFNNMQTGVQTESNVLVGLYFFAAYALLAIWASERLTRTRRAG